MQRNWIMLIPFVGWVYALAMIADNPECLPYIGCQNNDYIDAMGE